MWKGIFKGPFWKNLVGQFKAAYIELHLNQIHRERAVKVSYKLYLTVYMVNFIFNLCIVPMLFFNKKDKTSQDDLKRTSSCF